MSYSLSVFLSLSLFLSLFLFPSVTLPPSPPASLTPSIFYHSSCSLKFSSLLLSFWQSPIAVQTERAYYHYHCVDWYLHPQHFISYFCLNTGKNIPILFYFMKSLAHLCFFLIFVEIVLTFLPSASTFLWFISNVRLIPNIDCTEYPVLRQK